MAFTVQDTDPLYAKLDSILRGEDVKVKIESYTRTTIEDATPQLTVISMGILPVDSVVPSSDWSEYDAHVEEEEIEEEEEVEEASY